MAGAYNSAFEQNRALFAAATLRDAERFRYANVEFGIAPMPKFDVTQRNYLSAVSPVSGALLVVPLTANADRTSVILEAMAQESRNIVLPAYYDTLLMTKFYRDDESSEMLDIIFYNKIYDTGAVYNFGNIYAGFVNLASTHNNNVISFYERYNMIVNRDIERIVAVFEDMKN